MTYLKPNKTILIFFFLIIAFSLNAVTVPELQGHVNDYANILDSRAAQIDQWLTAFEDKTTVQVVILTIPSLPEDYTIEEYSLRVAETWQLGQKGKDNGVLITVALNDHKMRIEVGYGLEGVLTDAQAKLIILRKMTPKFKENDYTGGLLDAVNDICGLITGDAALMEEYSKSESSEEDDPFFIILGIIMLILLSVSSLGCAIPIAIALILGGLLIMESGTAFSILAAIVVALFIGRGILRSFLKKTDGGSAFVEIVDAVMYFAASSVFSGSSSSGGGYSGGGGRFGGGGASGSW